MPEFDSTDTDPICLMRYRNYKVHAAIGLSKSAMFPVVSVLDSGAGPNLVHLRMIPPGWLSRIRQGALPKLVDAQKRSINAIGTIALMVRLGQFKARVHFVVVTHMAVDCILGTSFIDRHVKAIMPGLRRVKFYHAPSVAIIGATDGPKQRDFSPDSKRGADATIPSNTVSNKVRLVRGTVLPPMTQTEVDVQTAESGLVFLQGHHRMLDRHLALAANGVMDVVPSRPFRILMSNFSTHPVRLPKNTVVATALPSPAGILTIDTKTLLGTEHSSDYISDKGRSTPTNKDEWKENVSIGLKDENARRRVYDLLEEFRDMWSGQLGTISATEHRIEVDRDSRPIYQQPYRAGPKARDFEKEEVDRMLAAGVIEPSSADWASPVVFVPKKYGTLRFCVDYMKLNAVTRRDSYPLPRMDECIDSLGEATIFSTLDCNSGYWQVKVADQDKDKTTFTCHSGLYRFLRMPFGLKNAPATFQMAIDIILSRVK